MKAFEQRLYSAAQIREAEQRAASVQKIASLQLMRAAAAAAWAELRRAWPKARRIGVVCGPGNNGGDGYELARLARAARCKVPVWQYGSPPGTGDAATTRAAFLKSGGKVQPWTPSVSFADCEVLVDALFGIGLNRPLSEGAVALIQAMNAAPAKKLVLDIPSGLHADTGAVMGACIRADRTVTFIGYKLGQFQGAGPEVCGELSLHPLKLPTKVYPEPSATLMHADDLASLLPRRARESHKGEHGHVLVVGGDHGMMGAALLAARGALRGGAGWVSVATRGAHAVPMTAAQPELMCHGLDDARELALWMEKADVLALGPGLGQTNWGRALFAQALSAKKPIVLDADGLNWLAQNPSRREDWVLTPHPGEVARLLETTTKQVQADRLAAARELQARYGGVAVLKGADTVVCDSKESWVCTYGNPGMAVGGMGDVLAGLIAALIGQGMNISAAARAGVLAHALAGDAAATGGQRGLLPSDLLPELRRLLNP